MNASIPADEAKRLASLHSYRVLDSAPEQAFDDLTLLAAQICQVPMVAVSLVDAKRQWFKSKVGLTADETPREIAFCAHTILHRDEIFEIEDAQADPNFASSPLVTADPHVRFYAGAPLIAPDGAALGALCVMDHSPRQLTPLQTNALRALSRRVVAQLELRRRTDELAQALADQERSGIELRKNLAHVAAAEKEANRLLEMAERSRLALLSVLEDEKRTGQDLRESEARFRQLTASIDEVYWLSDPTQGSILYISPAYERIWGRTCEELYRSPGNWVQSIHPDERSRVQAAATKQIRGDYDEVFRIKRPDGAERWIHARAYPVRNAAGEVYRVAGVAQDITEKKQLEAQFFRAQRLESIGTLASGIAHDLNNILAPIMMSAPLIRLSRSPKETENMLQTIETSAQRGAQLVRQLLAFGRGVEGEKRLLSVGTAIREMKTISQQTFPKNIAVMTDCPDEIWAMRGDATQLHQILLNLCVNARDAMPSGGMLTIRATNVTFDDNSAAMTPGAIASDYVRIDVTDTGTGMTPEIIDKIFDPFFTTKEIGKGTGLGLATVLGLVKSHGGFVTLNSEPGKGSTFHLHFPAVHTEEAGGVSVQVAAPPRGQGELILVIDDEKNIRDAVGSSLRQHGYTTVEARDGIEGLAQYTKEAAQIRLVITDVDMPNMGGITLIRVLKQLKPELKIIVSSGLAGDQEVGGSEDALKVLAAAAVLKKPYTVDVMLQAVHTALAQG